MKKGIKGKIIILTALIVLLSVVAIGATVWLLCYDGLYLGMKYSDFATAVEEDLRFDIVGYSFYEKKNGDGMLVHFDNDSNSIDEIKYYPRLFLDKSKDRFSEIEPGMSLYEVISLVGVPTKTTTFGMLTMVFSADDGTEYCIYFSNVGSADYKDLSVSAVIILD